VAALPAAGKMPNGISYSPRPVAAAGRILQQREARALQPRGGLRGNRFSMLFHGPGDFFVFMKFPSLSYLSQSSVSVFHSWYRLRIWPFRLPPLFVANCQSSPSNP
jgi:hypothetical protein